MNPAGVLGSRICGEPGRKSQASPARRRRACSVSTHPGVASLTHSTKANASTSSPDVVRSSVQRPRSSNVAAMPPAARNSRHTRSTSRRTSRSNGSAGRSSLLHARSTPSCRPRARSAQAAARANALARSSWSPGTWSVLNVPPGCSRRTRPRSSRTIFSVVQQGDPAAPDQALQNAHRPHPRSACASPYVLRSSS